MMCMRVDDAKSLVCKEEQNVNGDQRLTILGTGLYYFHAIIEWPYAHLNNQQI